jgi:hypothetical protein
MRFNVVLVCSRCGEHRAVVVRHEEGKKRGYCQKCAEFVRGEISEGEAPRERPAVTAQRTGWMKPFRPTRAGSEPK